MVYTMFPPKQVFFFNRPAEIKNLKSIMSYMGNVQFWFTFQINFGTLIPSNYFVIFQLQRSQTFIFRATWVGFILVLKRNSYTTSHNVTLKKYEYMLLEGAISSFKSLVSSASGLTFNRSSMLNNHSTLPPTATKSSKLNLKLKPCGNMNNKNC